MSETTLTGTLDSAALSAAPVHHLPIKRVFDLCFSFTVLALGAPIFAALWLAVRLSSRGKAVYSHERIGRGGVPFRCYKFRTMYADADERLASLLQDPEKKKEWVETRKLKRDPRVTPLGQLLRKSSLDELPQFWNVIKGDLSVVGPRPVVREEVTQYMGPRALKILSVRPGLTGIWQVSGRNHTTYAQRLDMDESYIDGQSLKLDIQLILKTIPCMLLPSGAY